MTREREAESERERQRSKEMETDSRKASSIYTVFAHPVEVSFLLNWRFILYAFEETDRPTNQPKSMEYFVLVDSLAAMISSFSVHIIDLFRHVSFGKLELITNVAVYYYQLFTEFSRD